MRKKDENKRKVAAEIIRAAKLYKEYLVGRRFMYVFDGRYIEVIYKIQNFRHLTGVDTKLSAKRFYHDAVNGVLREEQIGFSRQHPYYLCARKIRHIAEVAAMAAAELFILEEITTQTQRYKFGTTDLNFTLCMNREWDEDGKMIGDCFVVQSLRDEDCFRKSKNVYAVTHIFSRANDKKRYTALLYKEQSVSNEALPQGILDLLDEPLISSLKSTKEKQ